MNILLSIMIVLTDVPAGEAQENWLATALIVSVIIGLMIGFFYALILKGQLTSVYKNDSAADYTKKNSFKVELRKDTFLYSKTEKELKPEQNQTQKN